MENIFKITEKYDNLLNEQKQTLKKMDRLINLAEQLLHETQKMNEGGVIR